MKAIHAKKLLILASAAILSSSFFGCGRPSNEMAAQTGFGQCIPITETNIPFTAQNAYVDNMNIRAGQIPGGYGYGSYNPSVGTVLIGGNITGGSYVRQSRTTGSVVQMAYAPSAQYGVGALPGSYQNYGMGSGTQGTFTGYLTLTDAERQAIAQTLQTQVYNGGYGYANGGSGFVNGYQPTIGACISGMAFQFQYYGNQLGGGALYLYLNNSPMSQHTIQF